MKISPDKYTGCLLGAGIGDAMGYPAETLTPAQIRKQFGGCIKKYEQRRSRPDRKPGSITDDTQMTLCIGESLASRGRLDPDDIARRFVAWLDYGVGVGRACVKGAGNIKHGTSWRHSGVNSAGNGAAMRVAPIGLFFHNDKKNMLEACRITGRMTHTDPRAIAGAVAVAGGVALCLHNRGAVHPKRFVSELVKLTKPISKEFAQKLAALPDCMKMDAMQAMDKIRTGAFVMESVPAAIYAFLRFHTSFENTVLVAVNAGYDADTVASIAGSLTGALLGASAIPHAWKRGLQHTAKTKLVRVAEKLYSLSN